MTVLTPIPLRAVLTNASRFYSPAGGTDYRHALGTEPFGLGLACIGCHNRTGACVTATVMRNGSPLCVCCAGRQS